MDQELPSLDELMKEYNELSQTSEGSGFPPIQEIKLPDIQLPKIENLNVKKEIVIDEVEIEEINEEIETNEVELEEQDELEDDEILDNEEEIFEEINRDDEDFSALTEDDIFGDYDDDEEILDDIDNFDNQNDDDFENEEDIDDEDFEDYIDDEENYTQNLLPTKSSIEEDIEEIEEEDDEEVVNNKKAKKEKEKKEFKEVDDEAIKDFFVNLKNNLFNKEKVDKNNKSKIKNKKGINPAKIAIPIIIAIIIIFTLIIFIGKSGKPLDKITNEISVDKGKIIINNIEKNDKSITATFKNERNTSTSFFVDITFRVKKSLFQKENFSCQSDIIFIEANQEVKETVTCNEFIEAGKYGIKVNFNEIK